VGGNGAYEKVIKLAPFVVEAAGTNSAGAAVKSSPTALDGVVYFGPDDGKLYAYTTADGNPVAGFPVDVATAVGAAVKIQARPAVRTIDGTTRVYFTTDRGDVGRVNADGTGLLITSPPVAGANNVGSPAVTTDGSVYVGLSHPLGSGVVKLNPDMTVATNSPLLGGAGSSISSVAVEGDNVYVGLTGGVSGDIVLLNATDLTPRGSGVAGGEGVTAPPYVDGVNAYVGTLAGNFYKVNSITFAADTTFGIINTPATPGYAAVGEPLPTSPFLHEGAFFVGSSKGKVWQIDALTGAFSAAYDTGDAAATVGGVVVNHDSDTVAFGTSAGVFYEFPVGGINAQVFRGYGPFNTTPTLDRATGRFLIGSDDQNVYAFSSR
jgi:outer membrane protein assembly factor BamB